MIRRPPRSTPFPTRRSSDLAHFVLGKRERVGCVGFVAPLERSEEHTSELQSPQNLVCRLLLEKKKNKTGAHEGYNHGLRARAAAAPSPAEHSRIILPGQPRQLLLLPSLGSVYSFFFFNDTAPTEISPLSLPDAFPI